MTETDNNISDKKLRLTIRFSRKNMAFAVGDRNKTTVKYYRHALTHFFLKVRMGKIKMGREAIRAFNL